MKASRNVIARIAPRIAQLLVALAFGGPPPAQAQGAREILDASGPFLTAQALSADQFGRVDVFMDNDLVRFVPTAGTHRLGYEFGGVLDALRDADGSSIGASSLGAFRFRLDDSVETLVPFDGDGTTFVESGNDVALGPDGSIYLADLSGHVFRRDPGGAVSLMPIADAYQIAAGPDGSLWWTTQIDPIVRRLPPGGAPIVVYDGTAGSSTPVLSLVRDMAIDAEGNAWLADMTNQLVRVAPDGTAQVLLSSSGTGTGPPFAPGIVRAGPDGSLWVYGGDDRIVRIAPDGTVRIMLERAGDGAHSFSSPRDMAVDAAGNVWVSGHASHNVFHVASDGTLTLVIDSNGDGVTPLQRPTNVLPDGEGGVYVGDQQGRLFHFAATGAISVPVASPYPGAGFAIRTLAAGTGGDVFFSRTNLPGIHRLRATGEVEQFWPDFPADSMISDSDGNLYVTRLFQHEVWRIASDGSALRLMNRNGDGLGHELLEPDHLALGPDGSLYVASSRYSSIFRRAPDGQTAYLSDGMGFEGPRGLAVDSASRLVVSGYSNSKLMRRDLDGVFRELLHRESLGSGPHMIVPNSLALDPNGDAYVSAYGSHSVFRVRPDGSASEAIGPAGAGPGHELMEPVDVAVAPSGVAYVVGDAGRVLRVDLREECDDGLDNDADGWIDADDASCQVGPGERDPTLACDDGLDNDGDGMIDAADPFCAEWEGNAEAPQCSDGIDNDGDGGIDWDGAGAGNADPDCRQPGQFQETPPSRCGLGAELPLLLAGWWCWRRRRRAAKG